MRDCFYKEKIFLLTLSADVQVGMSVIDANDLSLFMLTTILLLFSFFISEEIRRYSIMDDGCKSVLNCNEKKSNLVVEKGLPT